MAEKKSDFWVWVNKLREEQHMAWYRLEELGEVGNATIAGRYKNNNPPTIDNMVAISKALNVSMFEVLEKAGYVEKADPIDPTLRGLYNLMRSLSPDERREVFDYLVWHYRRDLMQKSDDVDIPKTDAARSGA